MPCGQGPDHAGTSSGWPLDKVARALPVDRHSLVDRSEDFREFHYTKKIAAKPSEAPMIHLY